MRACGLFSGIPPSTAADVSQRLIKVVEILISLESGAEGGWKQGGMEGRPIIQLCASFHVGFSPLPPACLSVLSSFLLPFVRRQ